MYTQKTNNKISLLISALLLIAFVACRRDNNVVTDINSPAFHISESEKLAIPAAIDIPANLPNGNTRIVTFFAEGVQKYKAQLKAGSNPATYEWVFVAPEADLYNAANVKIGKHFAGPTWQLTGLRSDSITGQQFNPAKFAASPQPDNIDWLQLAPKTGKIASGIFSDVSYIQRIATTGGKAPLTLPVSEGQTIDVGYTAVYRFTKKNP